MKNIIDGSSSLMDLHVKKKKMSDAVEEITGNTQINNLIVGSTKELLELVEGQKNG